MGENGLFGCLINYPENSLNENEKISYTAYGLMNREIERVDSAYRSMLSVQNSLVVHPIHQFGSKKLKDRLLPKLISGEMIGSFGLTEPDHGSDPGGLQTVARKEVIFLYVIGV